MSFSIYLLQVFQFNLFIQICNFYLPPSIYFPQPSFQALFQIAISKKNSILYAVSDFPVYSSYLNLFSPPKYIRGQAFDISFIDLLHIGLFYRIDQYIAVTLHSLLSSNIVSQEKKKRSYLSTFINAFFS